MAKRGHIVGRLSIAILLVVVLLTSSIITGCGIFEPPASQLPVNEGDELYEQGRLDEAIDKYTEAIRIEPRWEGPYCKRGTAYYDLGQFDLAIKDFNEAIRLDPWGEEGYYGRGFVYKAQGRKAEAIADFEKVTGWTNTTNPQMREIAEQQIEELSR